MDTVKQRFLLFWLDAGVNDNDENRKAQKELRSRNRRLEIFDNPFKFRGRYQSLTPDERVVVIVSGSLGAQIVPQIHDLPQTSAIYVYCMDKKRNEQWAESFPKVKDVINEQKVLFDRIRLDKTSCMRTEERMSFNIYSLTRKPERTTRDLQKLFTYSLVLVKLLLQLDIAPSYDQRLIALYKKEFPDDSDDVKMLRKFKEEYPSNSALWSYTRDSPLYDMLHDALTNNNLNRLLLYHFVIKDIYEELKRSPRPSSDPVYYSQLLTNYEIKYLEKSLNGFMLVKTFLRTNSNRDQAEQFWRTQELYEYMYRVLFIITVSPQVAATSAFAAIDKVSGFIEPGAILFMAGSIFRLTEVTKTTPQDVIIRMELCNEDVAELQPAVQYMQRIKASADNRITLYDLANILAVMEKYDTAERIYELLTHDTSPNGPSPVDLYSALANVSKRKREHCNCVEWYKKALKSQIQAGPNNLVAIGRFHGFIGDAYQSAEKSEEALEQYKTAVEKYKQGSSEHHPDLADIYTNMGSIYKRREKDDKALEHYQKAIDIDTCSTTIRQNAAKTHSNMGMIYYKRQQYDRAMDHYKTSIVIRRQFCKPLDLSLALALDNTGHICVARNDLQGALESYQEGEAIFTKLLPSHHVHVVTVRKNIEQLIRDIKR